MNYVLLASKFVDDNSSEIISRFCLGSGESKFLVFVFFALRSATMRSDR